MSITTIVITFLREKINNESSSIAISEGIEKRLLEGYPDIEKFKGHQQDHLSLVVKGYILSASMHNPIDLRAPPPKSNHNKHLASPSLSSQRFGGLRLNVDENGSAERWNEIMEGNEELWKIVFSARLSVIK